MIVHKVIWAWNDDREEAWLRTMALQGWQLADVGLFTYVFVAGQGRDMVYCLDFMPAKRRKDEYFQLFEDAGWERVAEFGGWQYWRKAVQEGKVPEIFTDVEFAIRKYRYLLRQELAILVLLAADIAYMLGILHEYGLREVVSGLLLPLAATLLLFYICLRLFLRIRQLRRL